jgi:hypothetical protein
VQRGRTAVGTQSALIVKPALVLDALRVTGRPLMSCVAGLSVGVDKMLARLRETVKI